jgi:hypothetical protein
MDDVGWFDASCTVMCCPHGCGQWLPGIWRSRSDQKRREFSYTKGHCPSRSRHLTEEVVSLIKCGGRGGGVCVVMSRLLKLGASGDEVGLSLLPHLPRLKVYGNVSLRSVSHAILRTEDTGFQRILVCAHALMYSCTPRYWNIPGDVTLPN